MSSPSTLIELMHTTRPWSDARLQLWVRVYAAEYEVMRKESSRDGSYCGRDIYRRQCRAAADAMVADFDERFPIHAEPDKRKEPTDV